MHDLAMQSCDFAFGLAITQDKILLVSAPVKLDQKFLGKLITIHKTITISIKQ